ncbi:MAG: hypothetical protein KAS38_20255, partial [Anaerolineales bacterium]|nr:hypothetical protein [Anaerolineales bacterium]
MLYKVKMNWIPVIINPSAGRKTAVLAELNQVFRKAGIRWSVEITQEERDGVRFARRQSFITPPCKTTARVHKAAQC